MNGNIALQSSDLETVRNEILANKNDIAGDLNKIDNVMASVPELWQDINSKDFVTKFDELKTCFSHMETAIENFANYLEGACQAYKRGMEDVKSAINGGSRG